MDYKILTKNTTKKWYKISGSTGNGRYELAKVTSFGNACRVAIMFAKLYIDVTIE